MKSKFYGSLNEALKKLFANDTVTSHKFCQGGCINDAFVITLHSQKKVFCKKSHSNFPDMFLREAEALLLLAEVKIPEIYIPKVLGWGDNFLLLEYVELSPKQDFTLFGRGLAKLHKETQNTFCGLGVNNYIGSSVQTNNPTTSWIDFFREQRLQYIYKKVKSKYTLDTNFIEQYATLCANLEHLLVNVDNAKPCLLHGDLWSGNFLFTEIDNVVKATLIDPAIYYGHRETDLAMTQLFGGYSQSFYNAYMSEYPLQPGYQKRFDIYNLYHIMNHFLLFGTSYYSQAKNMLKNIVRDIH